ncbi:DNA polymerase III subunit delta [Sphingomonas sp.]|uniref:DNA polymerase III subunit delta n=1 Tax=Sphingomonas sp. TaxID=28214 RepID=UPI00286C91C8|nr:DNA polymerase III subunit delta [Sphingomonas sp.]
MKIAPAQAARAVDKPDPAVRFYLFYGPDDAGSRHLAIRLIGALGAEKFAISAAAIKADPAVLADEASAMALFGGPRAIWIEPAGEEIADGVASVLDGASVESPVIAIAGALRKTSGLLKLAEGHRSAVAMISYVPEGRDADQMVISAGRSEGLRIERDVASRLAAACGNNLAIVAQELAKFAIFLDAAPDRPRDLSNEVIDLLGADSADGNLMRLGDLALAGDTGELIEEFDRAALVPGETIPVVRALQRRLVQIAPLRAKVEQGERVDGVMASMGKSLFWKDKPLMQRLLTNWNAERIAQAMERAAAVERAAMLTDEPPIAALGEELLTIARAAGRRR